MKVLSENTAALETGQPQRHPGACLPGYCDLLHAASQLMSIRNGVVRRREGAHLYRPKCSYHVLQAAGAQREVRVDKLGEVVGVLDFLPPHQRNWTS